MEILDTTIVNVSLPHIAGSLSASYDDATWTLTSYLVANGIVLPIAGWLGRLIGRKRYFLICIAMFTVCSFLCGIATSLPQLVVFRLLQGLFGGGLQPNQQSIMLDTFEPSQRGAAFSRGGDRGDLRADRRADAGRLDHRQLFLALGVPDQRAGRRSAPSSPCRSWWRTRPGCSAIARRPRDIDYCRPGADRARTGLRCRSCWTAARTATGSVRRNIQLYALLAAVGIVGAHRLAADGREAGGGSACLSDRNFAVGVVMVSAIGAMLYSSERADPGDWRSSGSATRHCWRDCCCRLVRR